MNLEEIAQLVAAVTYKPGWSIAFKADPDRPYIQISVAETAEAALSPFTGERTAWRGGKRYLSVHMCRQEIVGACLGAIKDAEMHELHEWFKYRGRSIYNPHIDPDALVEVVRFKRNLNLRENAMTMADPAATNTPGDDAITS